MEKNNSQYTNVRSIVSECLIRPTTALFQTPHKLLTAQKLCEKHLM